VLFENVFRSGLRRRAPLKKLHVKILLIAVFSASFLAMFLAIYLTSSRCLHKHAHSPPIDYCIQSETLAGPIIFLALNATNVPSIPRLL